MTCPSVACVTKKLHTNTGLRMLKYSPLLLKFAVYQPNEWAAHAPDLRYAGRRE
jgi:hypothetical protein